MPITELLEANAKKYPNEVSLVEINPDIQEKRRVTWRDYELIESSPMCHYRREITWHVFCFMWEATARPLRKIMIN